MDACCTLFLAAALVLCAGGQRAAALSRARPPIQTSAGGHGPGGATEAHRVAAHVTVSTTLPATGFVPDPVVSLVGVESFAADAAPGGTPTVTLGTGFVVRAGVHGAWVATAGHVVDAGAAAVYLVGSSGPHLADRVVRSTDPAVDLALLHVPSLRGVSPVDLSSPRPSAWAAEVACVRWPGWSYQSYPVDMTPRAFSTVPGVGDVLRTPTLDVLPGCSGGPLIVYASRPGEPSFVVGVTVAATGRPTGVAYVPSADVTRLLKAALAAS